MTTSETLLPEPRRGSRVSASFVVPENSVVRARQTAVSGRLGAGNFSKDDSHLKRPRSGWINGLVVISEFCFLLWLEHRRPLRRPVEPKLRRSARNLSFAVLSGVALQVTERPLIAALVSTVERRRWGLLKQCSMPRWLEAPLAVALMDYTLYLWHVLMHRSSWLWRLHLPHHVDLDLDASTALRFHFSELVVSIAWRAGQVALIGVSPSRLLRLAEAVDVFHPVPPFQCRATD